MHITKTAIKKQGNMPDLFIVTKSDWMEIFFNVPTMSIYIAHTKDEAQERAVKAILYALQVPYEMEPKSAGSPYNPEFAAKIKRGEETAKKGSAQKVTMQNLWK